MSFRRFRGPLRIAAAVAAISVAVPMAVSAVIVSPTAIFMGDHARSTQLTLFNSSGSPEEISMELRYGYPDADSSGALIYRLIDSVGAADPSSTKWIGIYPRRLTLGPGARQTVRLVATPPAGLADGEYWARLVIKSIPNVVLDVSGATPGVRAGLSLEMRTVLPVLFRRGTVTTGVTVRSLEAVRKGDSLIANLTLAREGNAAYLGNAHFELHDGAGRLYGNWRIPLAIHVDQRRRFAFHLDSAARSAGAPQLRLMLSSERGDLPASQLLQSPRVSTAAPVSAS